MRSSSSKTRIINGKAHVCFIYAVTSPDSLTTTWFRSLTTSSGLMTHLEEHPPLLRHAQRLLDEGLGQGLLVGDLMCV